MKKKEVTDQDLMNILDELNNLDADFSPKRKSLIELNSGCYMKVAPTIEY